MDQISVFTGAGHCCFVSHLGKRGEERYLFLTEAVAVGSLIWQHNTKLIMHLYSLQGHFLELALYATPVVTSVYCWSDCTYYNGGFLAIGAGTP